MPDREVVAVQLEQIKTLINELRTKVTPEKIETDIVAGRFAERTFQMVIQTAIDVAEHIVKYDRLAKDHVGYAGLAKGPNTREVFDLLLAAGWLDHHMQAIRLQRLVDLRDRLVHTDEVRYESPEWNEKATKLLRTMVRQFTEGEAGRRGYKTLLSFVDSIAQRLLHVEETEG